MALNTDPADRHTTVDRGGGAGRTILIIALVALVALAIAWAAGLFNVRTEGELRAPEVQVQGGSVPEVDVQAADVDVGTRTETIEVPTVNVTPPDERAGN